MLDDTRAYAEAQKQEQREAAVSVLAKTVTLANTLVTVLLIIGMIIDKHSVTVSLLSGVGYFAASTSFVITILSGALPDIWINAQNQKTLQKRDQLQYGHQVGIKVYKPPQIAATPATDDDMHMLEATGNFVPAVAEVEDTVRREAVAWVLQLYGPDGLPNPKKVVTNSKNETPGRLWAKNPSEPAINFLTEKGVAHSIGNGMRLNITRYPTIEHVKEKLRT